MSAGTTWTTVIVLTCATSALPAQSIRGERAGLSATTPPAISFLAQPHARVLEQSSNHWVRGSVIGGALGAAIGLFLYEEFEYETHSASYLIPWAFGGAVVGGLIGAR